MCGMPGCGEGSTTTEGIGHSVLRVVRSNVGGCPRLVSVEEARGDIGRGAFQEVDYVKTFSDMAKLVIEISDPDKLAGSVHQAFYTANFRRSRGLTCRELQMF